MSVIKLILLLAPTVIAVCALVFTVYFAKSTQKHNKLSVRPRLSINVDTQINSPQVVVTIENYGLGPAILINPKVYLDDEEFDLELEAGRRSLFSGVLGIYPETFQSDRLFTRVSSIKAGEKHEYLYFDVQDLRLANITLQNIENNLIKLKITIDYESLYDEKSSLTHPILKKSDQG